MLVFCRNAAVVKDCNKCHPDHDHLYTHSTGQGVNWDFRGAVPSCRRCVDKKLKKQEPGV